MVARRIPLALFALTLAIFGSTGGSAQAQSQTPPDSIVVTHAQVVIGGKTFRYAARAGLLPLLENDTGELMARMFFVSYTLDRPPGAAPRPLTFVWNGGPGSNSAQLHVAGVGPKRVRTGDSYPAWGPNTETELRDNQESWLPTSDLVFVDPIGTGFSRAASIAYRDTLYTDRGDTEAVAEFIRVYLNRFNGWASPLFIAGESYGTTRAMGVSEALEKRRTRLDGVVLISGGFDVGQHVPPELAQALDVSVFAATAYYHKRLSADLQSLPRDEVVRRAADWARSTYAPALARRDSLSTTERSALLAALHRYTGIDPHDVDQRTLIIQKAEFSDRLLADRGLELGRYDSRMTAASRRPAARWIPLRDPSLLPMIDLMQGTSRLFDSYVRDTLQYRNDLLYRGPFGEAFHPGPLATSGGGFAEDWMSNMWNRGSRGRGEAEESKPEIPPLRHALDLDPKLRVMNMKGMYDASCAAMDEAVSRVEPALKARIRNRCYVGGHMMYSDLEARRAMQRDFDQFVRDAIAARRASTTQSSASGRPDGGGVS